MTIDLGESLRHPPPSLNESAFFRCFRSNQGLLAEGILLCYRGYYLPHKYPRATLELFTGFMGWPKARMVRLMPKGWASSPRTAHPAREHAQGQRSDETGGGIRVERATQMEKILPDRSVEDCPPIQGDRFWKTVTRNGESDFGVKGDDAVVISFKMDRAKLYGIEFE